MSKVSISVSYGNKVNVKIVHSVNKRGSRLRCSFISTDKDYGTETIQYDHDSKVSFFYHANRALDEISSYLNATSNGTIRPGKASSELNDKYDKYNNSTLISIENALTDIISGRGRADDDIGSKVILRYALRDKTDILTGNFYSIPKGSVGTVVDINPRSNWNHEFVDIYLIRFDKIVDYQTKQPVQIWVSSLDIDAKEE